MAEIDSLEISIQSNIEKVNKNMDLLIKKMGVVAQGISAIGSNKGLEEFAKKAQSISSDMGNIGKNVSQSIKPIEEQAKKITKSIDKIIKEANEKTMNLTPQLNMDNLSAETKKYENQLRNMQNQLNKVLAMPSADKQERTIERLIANINEAKNALAKIESLKSQLKEIKTIQLDSSPLGPFVENFKTDAEKAEKTIEDFKNQLDYFREIIKSGGFEPEVGGGSFAPVAALSNLLEEVQEKFPQEYKFISQIAEELRNAENLSAKLRGNITETQRFGYDTGAIEKIFGIITEDSQKAQQQINNIAESVQKLNSEFTAPIGADTFRKKLEEIIIKTQELNQSGQMVGLTQSLQNAFAQMILPLTNLDEKIRTFKDNLAQMREQGQTIGIGASLIDAVTPINAIDKIIEKFNEFKSSASDAGQKVKESLRTEGFSSISDGAEISNGKIVELNGKLQELQNHLKGLKAEGFGLGFKDYDETISEIAKINEQLKQYEKKLTNSQAPTSNLSDASKRLKAALSGINAIFKKLNKGINSVLSKIGKLVKSMFSLGDSANKSNKGFNLSLKTILKYGFGIRSLYMLVNKLRSAVKDGMENLVQYSEQTNQSVSMLNSSMNQFKNAAAAAFAPILNAIAPALNTIIQLFIKATNAVNQFFAALTNKTQTRHIIPHKY